MEDLNREYAWAGSLQNGECNPQNCAFKLAVSEQVPEDLLAPLPFGHGVCVLNLGQRPKLLDALQTDQIKVIQRAFQEALPENCPVDTMVHLGLRTRLDQAPFQEYKSDLLLSVYSNDQTSAAQATEAIRDENYVRTQRDEVFTMQHLMQLGVLQKCEVDSENYRMHLAELMANALDSVAPKEENLKGRSPVMDICQTTVHSSKNGELVLGLGMNVGTSGVVFHTPSVGLTLYFPRDGDTKTNILPASNGRTVMYCQPLENQDLFKGTPVQEAMLQVAKQTKKTGLGSVCASHALGNNEYTHVNLYESTYKQRPKLDLFQLTSGSKWVIRSASLLTVVPGIKLNQNRLYGHVECNSLDHLIKYTDAECDSVIVPNDSTWRDQLTNLDDSGAAFNLIRPDNAVANCSNKVAGYLLPKAQVNELMKSKSVTC